jgi:uncharacterized protein YkwD
VRKTGFLLLIILVTLGTAQARGVESDPAAAQRVFQLLNQARQQRELPPLVWNNQLAQAALQHTVRMVRKNALSHQFSGEPALFDRLAKTRATFDRSGENVAFAANAEAVHNALMRSEGHRENILSPDFNAVGVAAVRNGQDLFVTQDFAHLFRNVKDSEVTERIAETVQSFRSQAGLRALSREDGETLAQDACQLSHRDRLAAKDVKAPGAAYIETFTMLDSKNLPSDIRKLATSREVDAYGVGSCFARTKTYPAGVYWVVMAFYAGSGARARR